MQPSHYKYAEECNTCGGHGKVERPCTWTADNTDRKWSRTYTTYVNQHCDDCDGSGHTERYE